MDTMTKGIIVLLAGALALPASAGLISRTFNGGVEDVPKSGNDCKGYFGESFDACQIFINDNGDKIEISPVIAKYDIDEDKTEINEDLFGDFKGNEISFTPGTSGTWTYNPGTNDPGIRYWAAKAGTAFNLFWYVADTDEATSACSGDVYNLACLNLAQVVETGTWATPLDKGLSHLTFYDSEPPVYVPEPASLTLLGLGMLGLGFARRKKARKA